MDADPGALFETFAARWLPRIEETLFALLPARAEHGQRLYDAMRYSVGAGGKRVRPLLVLAAGVAADRYDDLPEEALLRAGAAVEFIHTYSLIHDDLPAMDDDDLRRGKPTCHRQFDQATAILAGDALNTLAFEVMAGIGSDVPADWVLRAIGELAAGAGPTGMVLGQQADMDLQGTVCTPEALRFVHTYKTAMLLRASVRIGVILAGGTEDDVDAVGRFGLHLGLAFQVVDDILDVESDTATLGKTAGKDAATGKVTYPGLLGMAAAKELACSLYGTAERELTHFGARGDVLQSILHRVVNRRS